MANDNRDRLPGLPHSSGQGAHSRFDHEVSFAIRMIASLGAEDGIRHESLTTSAVRKLGQEASASGNCRARARTEPLAAASATNRVASVRSLVTPKPYWYATARFTSATSDPCIIA